MDIANGLEWHGNTGKSFKKIAVTARNGETLYSITTGMGMEAALIPW